VSDMLWGIVPKTRRSSFSFKAYTNRYKFWSRKPWFWKVGKLHQAKYLG